MVRDLGRDILDAISKSREVDRTLRRIRKEGYSLYLLVDCKREDGVMEAVDLTAGPLPEPTPVFRINGNDLSFLKSIGIDPTLRSRRRKGGYRAKNRQDAR